MRLDQVSGLIKAHQKELEKFKVKTLSVFGSVARNEAGPESDIDILVEFDGSVTFDRYISLKIFLEDLLKSPVDLVTRSSVREQLKPSVEGDARRVA